MEENELTCPRCNYTDERRYFKRMGNADQLRCLDLFRCPDCGYLFAPVPKALLRQYHEQVLGVKLLEK